MASEQLLVEIARQERLQEWILGLEKRISSERRFKVLTALRRELDTRKEEAQVLEKRIARLAEDAESQAI